jgi:hypothetical protein
VYVEGSKTQVHLDYDVDPGPHISYSSAGATTAEKPHPLITYLIMLLNAGFFILSNVVIGNTGQQLHSANDDSFYV